MGSDPLASREVVAGRRRFPVVYGVRPHYDFLKVDALSSMGSDPSASREVVASRRRFPGHIQVGSIILFRYCCGRFFFGCFRK